MHRRSVLLALVVLLPLMAGCAALGPASRPTDEPSPSPEPTRRPTPTLLPSAVPAPQEASLAGASCPKAFEEQGVVSQDVRIGAGGTLTLTLGAVPSVPCGWQEMSISDESLVRQIAHRTDWPAEGVTPMPGAPGVEVWLLEALEEGTSTVSVECTCLGEEGTGEELRGVYVLSVAVR